MSIGITHGGCQFTKSPIFGRFPSDLATSLGGMPPNRVGEFRPLAAPESQRDEDLAARREFCENTDGVIDRDS